MIIKIRYNTAVNDNFLYWRILVDGVEHLVSNIRINVPTETTCDFIEGVGMKHHITCESDDIIWNEDKSVIIN